MACSHCADPETGKCLFPYHGLAPHTHQYTEGGNIILGSTKSVSENEWPDNFSADSDADLVAAGTWTHCLKCGDGSNSQSPTTGEVK